MEVELRAGRIPEREGVALVELARVAGQRRFEAEPVQHVDRLRGQRARDRDVEVVHRPPRDLPAGVREHRRALDQHDRNAGFR